jgi:hypothetical protein
MKQSLRIQNALSFLVSMETKYEKLADLESCFHLKRQDDLCKEFEEVLKTARQLLLGTLSKSN